MTKTEPSPGRTAVKSRGRVLVGIVVVIAVIIVGVAMGGTPLPAGVVTHSAKLAPANRAPVAAPASQAPAAPSPTAQRVVFLQRGPAILSGSSSPHAERGACAVCHPIIRTQAAPAPVQAQAIASNAAQMVAQVSPQMIGNLPPTMPAAPSMPSYQPPPPIAMLPFQEAHWQGIEVVPLTAALARLAKVPRGAKGVLVDEATPPADLAGFMAGDLITSVGIVPTTSLESFIQATETVRDLQEAEVRVLRKGNPVRLWLSAAGSRLGTANGEAAPMIPPGSRPPHGYIGPCTTCHRIGAVGEGAVDLGDNLSGKNAPPILAGQAAPHRVRGPCAACHVIQ